MNDESRKLIDDKLEVMNTAYKTFNAHNVPMREAQHAIRDHNERNGNNNPQYVVLANELNTVSQEHQKLRMAHDIAKADYNDAKSQFGKNTTF